MKATWNGTVIASSDTTIVVEGNHYFPPDSIEKEHFLPGKKHTECPWKGTASYFHIEVDEKINRNAAWTYPNPKPAANHIKNYIAFWKGIQVSP